MIANRIVGSRSVRAGTVAAAAIGTIFLTIADELPLERREVIAVAVVAGILSVVGTLHSSHLLYSRWMRFADRLREAIVLVLFGSCYLLVVPVFRLYLLLSHVVRFRKHQRQSGFWIERHTNRGDRDSFVRMG